MSGMLPELWGAVKGYTLIELMIGLAIAAVLAMIAIPFYEGYLERNRLARAFVDLAEIQAAIDRFESNNFRLPDTLAQVEEDARVDPWGFPYRYLRLDGNPVNVNGQRRRDRNLNPVNTDYDLYSVGADGQTSSAFNARRARDDFVRAFNGDYFGLAEEF